MCVCAFLFNVVLFLVGVSMEMASNEDLQKSSTSSNDAHGHDHDNMVPDVRNHGYLLLFLSNPCSLPGSYNAATGSSLFFFVINLNWKYKFIIFCQEL